MEFLGFFPQFRAMILSVLPNVVQGIIASLGDFYTWKLAEKMYGIGSNAAMVTVSEYPLARLWMGLIEADL